MQLTQACISILGQLEDVVDQLSDEDFIKPSTALGNATIGQHLRHTIEYFLCLETGIRDGVVNYDKREHDAFIETDRMLALGAIDRIKAFVGNTSDEPLRLEVGYERHSENLIRIDTNYLRELSYNIEHAIHHMAIMKIGIREIAPHVHLSPDFGVAVSTLRHKDSAPRRS